MLVCNCAFTFHLRSINLKDIDPIGFSIKLHPLCHKFPGEFQEGRAKHKRPFPPASGASLFLSPLDEGLEHHHHLCDSIAQVSPCCLNMLCSTHSRLRDTRASVAVCISLITSHFTLMSQTANSALATSQASRPVTPLQGLREAMRTR